MSIYLGPDQWSLNNFMVSQIAVFGDRNGLADRVVSANSVPPLGVVRVRVPRDSLFICGFGHNNQGEKNSIICPTSKAQVRD
jgi:hypothetical protein